MLKIFDYLKPCPGYLNSRKLRSTWMVKPWELSNCNQGTILKILLQSVRKLATFVMSLSEVFDVTKKVKAGIRTV
jgi:hypothetical protein